jgi:hypothetical protein
MATPTWPRLSSLGGYHDDRFNSLEYRVMALVSITPANVAHVSGPAPTAYKIAAGVTITAGMVVYLSNREIKIATKATLIASGSTDLFIALAGGTAGQWIAIAKRDAVIDLGLTAVGRVFFLGATGTIYDSTADFSATDYVTILGYSNTAGDLVFKPVASSIQYV